MEDDDCVFCNIVEHKIPATIYYEDADVFVIQDILPKAPVHMLVISREHIPAITHTEPRHEALLGKMIMTAKRVAAERGVDKTGYRLSFNVGREGGQVVPHLHMHVLGGKQLAE
jgi:histidine triad (HIT) family protein